MDVKFYISITLALLLSGCGSSNSNEDEYDKTVLNIEKIQQDTPGIQNIHRASDIKEDVFEGTSKSIDKEEFLQILNSRSIFFNKKSEGDNSCFQDLLREYSFELTGNQYQFDTPLLDAKGCSNFLDVSKSSTYMDEIYVNPNVFTSTFSFDDFLNNKDEILSQRILSYSYVYKYYSSDDFGIAVIDVSSVSAVDDFNQGCVKSSESLLCKEQSVHMTFRDNILDKVDRYEYIYNVEIQDAEYFNSGTIEFKIDNWSGTMTYSSKDTAPTYTARSSNESVTGIFMYIE